MCSSYSLSVLIIIVVKANLLYSLLIASGRAAAGSESGEGVRGEGVRDEGVMV